MVARGEGRSCIVIKSVNGRNRGVVNVTYRPSLQEAFPRRNSRKPYLKQMGTVKILCRAYCDKPITVKNYKLTESFKEKHLLSRLYLCGFRVQYQTYLPNLRSLFNIGYTTPCQFAAKTCKSEPLLTLEVTSPHFQST